MYCHLLKQNKQILETHKSIRHCQAYYRLPALINDEKKKVSRIQVSGTDITVVAYCISLR